MSAPSVVVHRSADLLAEAAAARLVSSLVDAQAARGHAHLVLTGGGIGIATLAALARLPARDAIDWGALDVWWGDERFLPAGHPDRNETQAREALLDVVALDPARVHPMPAAAAEHAATEQTATGHAAAEQTAAEYGEDVDAAARAYAQALAAAARPEDHSEVPTFDVLLLGVGPDGHVASLFPGHPAMSEQERFVVGVRGAPKPPPLRVSLTLRAIRRAQDVWLLASGTPKAVAVSLALSRGDEVAVPAAGAQGQRRTLWLLDSEAAAETPPAVIRPADR